MKSTEPDEAEERRLPSGWAAGDRVLDGDFVVGKLLGTGGFGAVYLVTAEPFGRKNRRYIVTGIRYAAKRVRMPGQDAKDAFLEEIQNWQELPPHPNILPYRFFRDLGDEVIVFSEYAPGGSLADSISAGEVTDPLDVAIQAARGLAVLHERGLIHLDVKPQNLLFREDGILVVADFGLAAATHRYTNGLAKVRGRTQAYASPEHYETAAGVGADVWAWAVCVLELFIGRALGVAGPQAEEALKRHRAALPEEVADLLYSCFRPDPADRPQDLGEIAKTLITLYEASVGSPYPRPVPTKLDADSPGGDRWFKARRYASEAHDALVDAIFEAEDQGNEARVDELYDLMLEMPPRFTLTSPDIGQAASARAFNSLRVLRDTRKLHQGMIALGYTQQIEPMFDATMALANEYIYHGDHFGARVLAAERLAQSEDLVAAGRIDLLPVLFQSLRLEATLLDDTGDAEGALDALGRGSRCIEFLLNGTTESFSSELVPKLVTELFILFCEHGVTAMGTQNYDIALASLERAFAFRDEARARWGADPDAGDVGWGKVQLGNALDSVGRSTEAIAAYDDAIASLEPSSESLYDLSSAHLNKGITLGRMHEFAAAELAVREAVRLRADAINSIGWRERHDLAFAQITLSNVLRGRGNFTAAEEAAEAALALWKQLVEDEGHVQLGQYQYMAIMEVASAGAEIGY